MRLVRKGLQVQLVLLACGAVMSYYCLVCTNYAPWGLAAILFAASAAIGGSVLYGLSWWGLDIN